MRRFIPFPVVFSLKVNLKTRLEFELSNYDIASNEVNQ